MNKKHPVRSRAAVIMFSAILLCLLTVNTFVGNTATLSYIDKEVPSVGINAEISVTFDAADGYSICSSTENYEFRVMQLTDIHFACGFPTVGADKKAVAAISRLVTAVRPDLIVLTGDTLSPITLTGATSNTGLQLETLGALFERLEVPWIAVFGNHDGEGMFGKEKIAETLESLPYSLFRKGPENADGYGNTTIRLFNADGTCAQVLYFFDSHGGGTGNYDGVHENQIAWYREKVSEYRSRYGDVPSVAYFHIPPKAYAEMEKRYTEGDASVTLLSGKNYRRIAYGMDFGLYDAFCDEETTKYAFFGHDHKNSAIYKDHNTGVSLGGSLSIDYSTYPTARFTDYQRGCNLLRIRADGSVTVEQILLSNVP